jgi:hypothetical protein
MKLIKHNFGIIQDNETTYLNYLQGIIDSSDELATVEIFKNPLSISCRIACSNPRYTQIVLQQILEFHTLLNIKLNLSKSIRNTQTINFDISI